jgi:hypothetical protein
VYRAAIEVKRYPLRNLSDAIRPAGMRAASRVALELLRRQRFVDDAALRAGELYELQ